MTYKSNMNKQSDNDYKVVKSLVCGDKERLYNLYLLMKEGIDQYIRDEVMDVKWTSQDFEKIVKHELISHLLQERQNEIFENISRKEWR